MISVGSRDGMKGLSLRYGVEGGDMDLETELEEGEAFLQNNNGDDSTIDPDVALSYLDDKLQNVLGHFQKDFEGGVSAENLGAKFGGYGSFLPTYQRSPACPHPKTTNNASVSPNDLHIEGGRQNSASVNASHPIRHGPASTNGEMKQEKFASNTSDQKSKSQQPVKNNFLNASDQKSLKVRIKVGSDHLSTRKNAEIYSGLGLDVSPSSSLEANPVDSEDFCHVPGGSPRGHSPTSILELMTSFPVLGETLLSPLPYDLLHLTKKENFEDSSCGFVHKRNQESTFVVSKSDSKSDRNVFCEKKPKTEDNNVRNGICGVTKKETEIDNLSCEELVSNALRLPLLSNTNGDVLDFKNGGSSVITKEESLDPVLTHDDFRVEKPSRKDGAVGNLNSDDKYSFFPTKSDSDVSKGGKIWETGLIKPPKQKAAQKATPHEKNGTKLSTSSSGVKKKSKRSQSLENGFQRVEVLKAGLKNESSSKSKNNTYGSKMDDPENNKGKVRETYKDFFEELDPELDDVALEEKPFRDRSGQHAREVGPGPHIAPATGNGPVSDAASATVAAVVNEDWVCCDKCEKWRLLPPGVNPGSLPEKWLCSMLDWLPGLNRCSISQEETTKAIISCFQPVHPGGPQLGVMSAPSGVKKKHGTKELPNETKQERPSLSSNSTKKNLQISDKSRSLNGASQSFLVNEAEFQDSGQSSSLSGEKHRLKHKEKKKLRETVDEGNNYNALQLKIRNKRETSQDFSRDPKKVKTDYNHGSEKDRASDHDRSVFKAVNSSISDLPSRKDHPKYDDRFKDSKSSSKVLGINPKSQTENGTSQMGKFEERDVAKKRKSNEFEDSQIEETSESGQRKGKKLKVLDSSRKDASLAAASSSSKVSGSHKTKTNNQEAKGSPVESVSSSPLRILNPDKLTSSRRTTEGVNNCQDDVSPKQDIVNNCQDEEGRNGDQSQSNGSRSKKNGKGSSLRSKEKIRASKSEHMKETANKFQEKPFVNSDMFEKGSASKKDSSGKHLEVSESGKPHLLPPSGNKGQNETTRPSQPFSGSQKENAGNSLMVDGVEDASKATKQKKKGENQNRSQSIRQPTPIRESSSQAATAIREAKTLKHMADRLKNSGSNHESNSLYFQAALKFLYGSSLLESNYTESGKHGDMIQSMDMYSSTAKLCEYVAHEYEKSKEMAAAALAYKLAEVAYLKVVYSSHTSASKDRQELQTLFQIGATGESPSSSASDIDNLNNPAAIDKAAVAKGGNEPQIGGNHVIAARNKPNFVRILNFAQDVNLAMEASRKSQIAFAASHTHHKEVIKPALDFNFQDVEGLLQLVRVAMEVISR